MVLSLGLGLSCCDARAVEGNLGGRHRDAAGARAELLLTEVTPPRCRASKPSPGEERGALLARCRRCCGSICGSRQAGRRSARTPIRVGAAVDRGSLLPMRFRKLLLADVPGGRGIFRPAADLVEKRAPRIRLTVGDVVEQVPAAISSEDRKPRVVSGRRCDQFVMVFSSNTSGTAHS